MEYFHHILLLIYYLHSVICDKECFDKFGCENRSENIYFEGVNKIYTDISKAIDKAFQVYKTCNNSNCGCYDDVIKSDLKRFGKGITKDMIDSVRQKGTKYQVIDGHLYRDKDCLFPSRCSGIEHFLLKLLPKLKDMEMIVNIRDWPQTYKDYPPFGPVFSFSKTSEHGDIMYPAWSFWEGGPAISLYPTGLGRWDKHRKSIVEAAEKYNWEKKLNKAFFRGSRTSNERDLLILLSREDPDLVDAQYTKNQAWKSDSDTLHAAPAKEVSLEEHCQYKFLFNFRGVAASFRFKHLFLCKSLVFHIGNDWQEFFYSMLKPWVHYIPVNTHATKKDIKVLLEYFKLHDSEAKRIADNGFQIIWDNLKMTDVHCYWRKLLTKYAKLFKYKPKLDENLIEIIKK